MHDSGKRLIAGMHAAIAALADAGNDLIVDDVYWEDEEASYRRHLADHDFYFIALHVPLAAAEERERNRGDRDLGLARWQFPRVHAGCRYDLELDSTTKSPGSLAKTICERFSL